MKNGKLHKFLMVAVAVLALTGMAHASDVTLTGNYLNVGVNNSGALINSGVTLGIQFDPTGTGNFAGAPDFITPGSPFEFYSVGVNGTFQGTAVYGSNPFGAVTFQTGSGATQASSTFALLGGSVIMTQTTYFNVNSKSINFSVDFINNTAAPITVQYARGLDPDQDAQTYGIFDTNNSLTAHTVTAVGPVSGLSIQIQDLLNPAVGAGVPSVNNWTTDPYALLLGGNLGNGDNAISMAWNFTIPAGNSAEVDFRYNVSAVPLPPALLLFAPGLLGLIGIRKRFNA